MKAETMENAWQGRTSLCELDDGAFDIPLEVIAISDRRLNVWIRWNLIPHLDDALLSAALSTPSDDLP